MDADDEDPVSAGPAHPSVFYGFWPRFAVDADADGDEATDAGADPGTAG